MGIAVKKGGTVVCGHCTCKAGSKITSLAMTNHQEADGLIQKLLKELNDLLT